MDECSAIQKGDRVTLPDGRTGEVVWVPSGQGPQLQIARLKLDGGGQSTERLGALRKMESEEKGRRDAVHQSESAQ